MVTKPQQDGLSVHEGTAVMSQNACVDRTLWQSFYKWCQNNSEHRTWDGHLLGGQRTHRTSMLSTQTHGTSRIHRERNDGNKCPLALKLLGMGGGGVESFCLQTFRELSSYYFGI